MVIRGSPPIGIFPRRPEEAISVTHDRQFYIDGAWVEPQSDRQLDVIDPSTEEAFARIACGSKADVDRAVAAARQAFRIYSRTSPAERGKLLRRSKFASAGLMILLQPCLAKWGRP